MMSIAAGSAETTAQNSQFTAPKLWLGRPRRPRRSKADWDYQALPIEDCGMCPERGVIWAAAGFARRVLAR